MLTDKALSTMEEVKDRYVSLLEKLEEEKKDFVITFTNNGVMSGQDWMDATPFLISGLQHEQDSMSRGVSAYLLGMCKADNVVPVLIGMASDTDWFVRFTVALAASNFGSLKLVAPIFKLLRDENHLVQYTALLSLERMIKRSPVGEKLPSADALVELLRQGNLAALGDYVLDYIGTFKKN